MAWYRQQFLILWNLFTCRAVILHFYLSTAVYKTERDGQIKYEFLLVVYNNYVLSFISPQKAYAHYAGHP